MTLASSITIETACSRSNLHSTYGGQWINTLTDEIMGHRCWPRPMISTIAGQATIRPSSHLRTLTQAMRDMPAKVRGDYEYHLAKAIEAKGLRRTESSNPAVIVSAFDIECLRGLHDWLTIRSVVWSCEFGKAKADAMQLLGWLLDGSELHPYLPGEKSPRAVLNRGQGALLVTQAYRRLRGDAMAEEDLVTVALSPQ